MSIIAVDGASATGKSTIAKLIAQRQNGQSIDTGEFLRTVTAITLERGIDPTDATSISRIIASLRIGSFETVTNSVMIEEVVPILAAHASVQLALANDLRHSIKDAVLYVVTGRSIGATIFPDASLKIYLSASQAVRAMRKEVELKIPREQAFRMLERRDRMDFERTALPAQSHPHAIEFDTSKTLPSETASAIVDLYRLSNVDLN